MPKKTRFKAGDVVRISERGRACPWFSAWVPLNGDGAFLVKGPGWGQENVHLVHPDGKRLKWSEELGNEGLTPQASVFEGWLIRDSFLTAVHKAKSNAVKV